MSAGRSWICATSSLGSVVTKAKVSRRVPSSRFHESSMPAKAKGPGSVRVMAKTCLMGFGAFFFFFAGRLDENMPKEELYLFEFASSLVTQTGAAPTEIMRRNAPNPKSEATCLTIDQTTLAVNPLRQTLPVLLTERKRTPLCSFAEAIQVSTAALTQFGTGTIRMCPPLPTRSAKTQ
jgi:hypothetical protein